MFTYKTATLGIHQTIVRIDDNKNVAFIPVELSNSDYQQYLAWVAEGNTAEEWNPQG